MFAKFREHKNILFVLRAVVLTMTWTKNILILSKQNPTSQDKTLFQKQKEQEHLKTFHYYKKRPAPKVFTFFITLSFK